MIHPSIKESLGFDPNTSDAKFLETWNKVTKKARKPCWDLEYCPYGPLVEQFPLLPQGRAGAIRHNEYLKGCLNKGRLGVEPDTKPMTKKIRKFFEHSVAVFNPDNYPEEIPENIYKWSCAIFGHLCPVVTSAEDVAEKPED
jgi:hypothetical protein